MNLSLVESLRRIVLKDSIDLIKDYEATLLSADEKRKADKKAFEEKSAQQIKELKAKIKEISNKIKNASIEEKIALSQNIKDLNKEIETLQQPMFNHFVVLSSDIKGYANSIFLLKELVKEEALTNANIPYEIDEKGKIIVDYNILKDSSLGSIILETSDYIFDKVREYGNKVTQPSDIKNIIKSDYARYFIGQVKTDDTASEKARKETEYNKIKIDFETIEKCKREYDYELADIAKKKKSLDKRIADSKSNIEIVKDYGNGLFIVELLPGKFTDEKGQEHHVSISFESDEMGHCVGRGGYDNVIGKEGYKFYSLRSYNSDGVFEPHCTISIENGSLRQIKGKSNLSVKAIYVKEVRDFVESLSMPIPNSERALIGYVNDLEGKEIDLYNLKENTSIDSLELAAGDYKYINLEYVKRVKKLSFQDNQTLLDCRAINKIKKIDVLIIDDNYPLNQLPNFDKLQLNSKTRIDSDFLEKVPYSRHGISYNNFGDLSHIPLKEVLTKIQGTEWANESLIEHENKLSINSDLNLSSCHILKLSDEFKNIYIKGKLILPYGFGKGGNNTSKNILDKLPYSEEGIICDNLGDLRNSSMEEIITKLKGTIWVNKNLSKKDGKIIINTDLDLDKYGITFLPKDLKDIEVNGSIKLSCIMPTHELPKNHNGLRFREEIDFKDVTLEETLSIIKGKKWVEENLVYKDGKVIAINGDLDLSADKITRLSDEIYDVDIKGCFSYSNYTILDHFPKCKHLSMCREGSIKDTTIPDSIEKVTFVYNTGLNSSWLKGKSLKNIEYLSGNTYIRPEDMKHMSPDIIYKGNFIFTNDPAYGHTRNVDITFDQIDISDIKIDGKAIIMENIKDLKWLPNVKEVDLSDNRFITNEMLADLKPCVKHLQINNTKIDSFNSIPENVHLETLSKRNEKSTIKILNTITNYDTVYNIHIEDSNLDFIANAKNNENIYSTENDNYKNDYSSIKVKEITINRRIDSIKNLPQAKTLKTTYGNDLSPDFLKDLPPFTEELLLNYTRDADISLLPENSMLKKIDIMDMHNIPSDSFKYLPKTIEEISLFESKIQDLSLVSTLPNLKKIRISRGSYPDDAINKIHPEKLKTIELDCKFYNPVLYRRREEIIAIHDAPSSEKNDKLKTMNEWLCKDDNKREYLHKEMAFYKVAMDIIDGKYNGKIDEKIMNSFADKFKDAQIRNCSEFIMAREINVKDETKKAGRKAIDIIKNKKANYYKKLGTFGYSTIMLLKPIVTKDVTKHPEYDNARYTVKKRMAQINEKLQIAFTEKLYKELNIENKAPKEEELKNTSFNNYLKNFTRGY